jgi:DNA repair protein RadC
MLPFRRSSPATEGTLRQSGTKRSGAHKYHNHPSGVQEPSQADELITVRVKEALALIDVRLVDHLILAGPNVLSFAQRGLL